MNQSFTDKFQVDCAKGKTIGTKTMEGVLRKGKDQEKAIAIDHQALRFLPLIKPGWGRQGIAYGKYQRTQGLAVSVLLLNGHNTSQAETIEWLYKRIPQWLKGSKTESIGKRIVTWLGSQHKQGIARRILAWLRMTAEVTKFFPLPKIDDNLAVGWFSSEIPYFPTQAGNNLIVRATGAENGELLTKVASNLLSVFRGLQNVPVYYVVILRDKGAAYYASSLPLVYGLPAYPHLRPIAIDAVDTQTTLYAGVYQSVLGQIGFRAYTRVYGVKVETVSELATWYGTAEVADSLTGTGNLTDIAAEVGGNWEVVAGGFRRTPQGLIATQSNSMAIAQPQNPIGLIHLKIECKSSPTGVGIVWRWQDADNYWCCWQDKQRVWVELVEAGSKQDIFVSTKDYLTPQTVNYLQLLDDGEEIRIYLDGKLIGDNFLRDKRLASAKGVGVTVLEPNEQIYLEDFEAHPRTVTIEELDLGIPWWREGKEIKIQDDFKTCKEDLDGKTTSIGNQVWTKTLGKGAIAITQPGIAKVQATVQDPNPGRTAYTIPWHDPSFADVEVTISPPGKARGQGEKGRAGLIFWQDLDNYIIINTWLDDFYEGESISCFFRIAGFEEVYDAVWSNIGTAIAFGQPYTLRVAFDGNNYTVQVNNQTVLYRALTDVYPWTQALKINRLGVAVNWEWGDDTGSGFSDFKVRS
ncbi:hypothetical protein NIES4102_09520 [Chondrocystis sp. NIES-4102]|nr:hypothetical protein NIES4102_09520 [Chondrocystis sp. NIES-4102]